MFKKSFLYVGGMVLITLACALGLMLWFWWQDFSDTKVVFLDVGQGDAILIIQGSNQVLIDGGRSGKILLERLGAYMPFWDHQIETIVATHPDEDHIGGLVDAIKTYRVGTMLDTKMNSDTAVYRALQEAKSDRHITDMETFSGLLVKLPDGGVMEAVHPFESLENNHSKDTNATSIVMKLTTASGETFLFTGDLPDEQENLIDPGKVDVLKAGHHGSKSSSSDSFLKKLSPRDAILSVGANNRYGHPAPEVIDRLRTHHANIFRTDMQGSILYRCPPEKERDCMVSTAKN
ncbi:MAG: MBL fold metallo-hydrolase [Candidatus Moranbacteria bacterium]|nr:MBL fold metallo-hydrolase [Candidatus Moranbacteria bacterium]